MPSENHERERIIIESSILVVTLLFVISGIRDIACWSVSRYTLYTLSLVGAWFVFAAFIATLIMFLPSNRAILPAASFQLGLFMGGLAGLIVILFGIASFELGGNLDLSMLSALVIMSAVTILVTFFYHRLAGASTGLG